MKKITNAAVRDVFSEYPSAYREKIIYLRGLVLDTAKQLENKIGSVDEVLKWGQPSYLPNAKNIGSTLRIHYLRTKPGQYAMYFNCQTKLIARIKRKFPGKFVTEGKRAIIFKLEDKIPKKEIIECITMALTYHLAKGRGK